MVFWMVRRTMGPVTFVERQIAHVWAAAMCCVAFLFPLEVALGLDVLDLAPLLGVVTGMVFLVKAGISVGVVLFSNDRNVCHGHRNGDFSSDRDVAVRRIFRAVLFRGRSKILGKKLIATLDSRPMVERNLFRHLATSHWFSRIAAMQRTE